MICQRIDGVRCYEPVASCKNPCYDVYITFESLTGKGLKARVLMLPLADGAACAGFVQQLTGRFP